jgi:N-acyl-D-aspartate/D-glutamate deacylase
LFFKRHFDAKKSAIEDFVIRSGTVFDGLNSPVVQAAVLSRGGAIMGIGAIPPVEAVEIAPRHAGVY